MSIHDELTAELRDAMRAKDARRRDVIRQIETEVAKAKTAPGFSGEADDDLYRRIIVSYVKKMAKAKEEYEAAGDRGREMADKLAWEIDYLSRWTPQTLGEDETRSLVREAISELGVGGDPKAVGRVVGHLMKARRGELDGATVNRIVREELGVE